MPPDFSDFRIMESTTTSINYAPTRTRFTIPNINKYSSVHQDKYIFYRNFEDFRVDLESCTWIDQIEKECEDNKIMEALKDIIMNEGGNNG